MTEKSHHRTLRNHNTHRLGHSTHVGGGNVTAAESQRHIPGCGCGVEVAARGKDNSVTTHHETPIQLRQFLDAYPEMDPGDVARTLGMPHHRSHHQRPAPAFAA